jgi:hypothetical protein
MVEIFGAVATDMLSTVKAARAILSRLPIVPALNRPKWRGLFSKPSAFEKKRRETDLTGWRRERNWDPTVS